MLINFKNLFTEPTACLLALYGLSYDKNKIVFKKQNIWKTVKHNVSNNNDVGFWVPQYVFLKYNLQGYL